MNTEENIILRTLNNILMQIQDVYYLLNLEMEKAILLATL